MVSSSSLRTDQQASAQRIPARVLLPEQPTINSSGQIVTVFSRHCLRKACAFWRTSGCPSDSIKPSVRSLAFSRSISGLVPRTRSFNLFTRSMYGLFSCMPIISYPNAKMLPDVEPKNYLGYQIIATRKLVCQLRGPLCREAPEGCKIKNQYRSRKRDCADTHKGNGSD